MGSRNIIAVLLLVVGALGLAYGGFSYVSDTHQAKIGSLSLSVSENKHVYVPIWLSVAAIGLGGVLLVLGRKSN